MFKKLKDKIAEEVKSSPQRIQQFTQSVTEKIQNATNEENFFSIGDDDVPSSSPIPEPGFSNVSLSNYATPNSERFRKTSNSSIASDMSFLPRYESSTNLYHLQSDLDVSASEIEDNASTSSQLGHLSKEQIYAAFQKSQIRYHKYRGRYTDVAHHYKELERENAKMKAVLVETQDKALRRVAELKEQCGLEQKAKAHLENALRVELDEKQYVIDTLKTKIDLLQTNQGDVREINVEDNEYNQEILIKDAKAEIENLNVKIQELKANSIVFNSKESDARKKINELEDIVKKKASENAMIIERERENNLIIAQTKMELHTEIQNRDLEIENLKCEIENMKVNLEKLEKEPEGATNLQIQNSKLIERVEELSKRCKNYDVEILKNEQQKIEIENLNENLKSVRTHVRNLEEQKATQQVQVSKANSVLDEQYKQELDSKVKEILKLEEINANINSQLIKLQDEVDRQSSEYETKILTYREDAKQNLLSLEKKIKEKLKKEFELQEDTLRTDFQNKLEQLSKSGESIKDIHLKLISKEEELDKLTSKILDLEQITQNQVESYNNLEANHLELISERTQVNNALVDLKRQNEELAVEVIKLSKRAFILESENTLLKEENDRFKTETENIQAECANATKILSENETYRLKLEEVEAKLLSANMQITEIQNLHNALENNENHKLQIQVLDLQQQIADLNEKNSISLEEYSIIVSNLREKVETEVALKNSLLERIELLTTNLEKEKIEVSRLATDCGNISLEHNNSLNEIEVLNKQVVALQKDNQQMEAEYQKSNEEVETLHASEVSNLKLNLHNLEEKHVELKGKHAELDANLRQYSDEIEQNRDLLKEFDKSRLQYEKLLEENNNCVKKIANFVEQTTTFKVEIEKLGTQVYELTCENQKLYNHNSSLQEEISEQNKKASNKSIAFKNQMIELVEKSELEKTTLENLLQEHTFELDLVRQQISLNSVNSSNLLSENKNIQKFEEQISCLKVQLRELENQYTEICHEKQLLQDEIQELKASPINMTNCVDNYDMNRTIVNLTNSDDDVQLQKDYESQMQSLQEKLVQYKSLDLTNRSSIQFYENELQRLKNKNEKLNRKLDETLVTLNHCTELSTSTETVYLKNVLYNYMLGKESLVLARVIAAVCKFDDAQTDTILQREQQKQTLLGQLGFL